MKEIDNLHLPLKASAEEQIKVINHYLPNTRNLAENISMLRHLGLYEDNISRVLSGGTASLYGEITSMTHPTVKVVCPYSSVSIKEVSPDNCVVCIGNLPVEEFIRQERKRQEQMTKEVSNRSKEDLVKEVKSLRRDLKQVSDHYRIIEQENTTLRQLIELYKTEGKK